ncbi:tRNA (adenosine(37)-N6)-threonylcarbamoyltransferase complex dimerization subunit type 1 TsaB [Glaciimonas soli]|uniref:tRNA (Adenosine(37)-N6)-threonylcarbamoyltransferase complex dimerization subunit type 1 TsaB n=1 Tax=Glaciimonas soli TaxID=2590999 RepID=A0A843YW23_9BURK|nr:tRNA (adenosine(37)-N6)-threonylcarbamoyltransferase complex dimerization subunit type 1 TsaB [Glaciimonas soli]MQR01491.1 tRNA (adenosine(37)-N6)-threonylcarbamoyltransferase complex dimerization subunit type 1 TsaB [Glaciimonas soli]
MPIILAIETSTELASAALLIDNERSNHNNEVSGALAYRESEGVQTHSQTILPMVQSLLSEAGITLSQCDAIAFGVGPGSFTGVRTACGIVQGLAFGAELPVLPVSTLEAMAQACRDVSGAPKAVDVLCVLDARMGEVYWAQYRYVTGAIGGNWQAIVEPTLSAPSQVQPIGQVQACGNGLSVCAEQFAGAPFAANANLGAMPHARDIAAIGTMMFAQGLSLPAVEAQPLYLRNKIALTTAERALKGVMK